jgi:hypothetical protein
MRRLLSWAHPTTTHITGVEPFDLGVVQLLRGHHERNPHATTSVSPLSDDNRIEQSAHVTRARADQVKRAAELLSEVRDALTLRLASPVGSLHPPSAIVDGAVVSVPAAVASDCVARCVALMGNQ